MIEPMAPIPQAFYSLWQEEQITRSLSEILPSEDMRNLRPTSSACCHAITKWLFTQTHLTFTANTFTRPYRIQALSRIGHHIEHLRFYFPHSRVTFLPPLVHPTSGCEIRFHYTPHTSIASTLTWPKYGTTELSRILIQQYPPLFHAATHVRSFVNALHNLPNLRHLTIHCPGQDPAERYRRSIVDYALMSLRISLEQAPLTQLSKLTLTSLHPSAFLYLRYLPGFGGLPSSSQRWRQIRQLTVSVESWDFSSSAPGLDQLRIIEDYLRSFAAHLRELSFTWVGRYGPCPLALEGGSQFAPLLNKVTSTSRLSPPAPAPHRRRPTFAQLRRLEVCNTTVDKAQVKRLAKACRVAIHDVDVRQIDGTLALVYTARNSAEGGARNNNAGGSFRSLDPDAASRQTSLSFRTQLRKRTGRDHQHDSENKERPAAHGQDHKNIPISSGNSKSYHQHHHEPEANTRSRNGYSTASEYRRHTRNHWRDDDVWPPMSSHHDRGHTRTHSSRGSRPGGGAVSPQRQPHHHFNHHHPQRPTSPHAAAVVGANGAEVLHPLHRYANVLPILAQPPPVLLIPARPDYDPAKTRAPPATTEQTAAAGHPYHAPAAV